MDQPTCATLFISPVGYDVDIAFRAVLFIGVFGS